MPRSFLELSSNHFVEQTFTLNAGERTTMYTAVFFFCLQVTQPSRKKKITRDNRWTSDYSATDFTGGSR